MVGWSVHAYTYIQLLHQRSAVGTVGPPSTHLRDQLDVVEHEAGDVLPEGLAMLGQRDGDFEEAHVVLAVFFFGFCGRGDRVRARARVRCVHEGVDTCTSLFPPNHTYTTPTTAPKPIDRPTSSPAPRSRRWPTRARAAPRRRSPPLRAPPGGSAACGWFLFWFMWGDGRVCVREVSDETAQQPPLP